MIQAPTFERVAQDEMPDNDGLEYAAENIQRVLRITYSRLFEASGIVAPSYIQQHLFDEKISKRVTAQKERITTWIKDLGSIYWLAWDDDELIGLSKASPAPAYAGNPQQLHLEHAPGSINKAYLNDLASVYEGFGVGTSLLDKALSEFHPGMVVELDAFRVDSRANRMFEKLGFGAEPQGMALVDRSPDSYFEIGSIAIPQVRLWSIVKGVRDKIATRSVS